MPGPSPSSHDLQPRDAPPRAERLRSSLTHTHRPTRHSLSQVQVEIKKGQTIMVDANLQQPSGALHEEKWLANAENAINSHDASGDTVVDRLLRRASEPVDRVALRWLRDDGSEEAVWTCTQLTAKMLLVSHHLEHVWNTTAGDRALLVYSPGLHFVAAFLGCLHAGVVAVPVYPPDPRNPKPGLVKMASHARCAEPTLALTESRFSLSVRATLWTVYGSAAGAVSKLPWQETDRLHNKAVVRSAPRCVLDDSLAFIQFTSGSTGEPKGVIITHQGLTANLDQITAATVTVFGDGTPPPIICAWVPQYHDLGLCAHILWALHSGGECTLMSPLAFLGSPFTWLQAISRYKATHMGAPNFAYELCVHKGTLFATRT